jgi:DNA helicase HerA-like ATPase
LLDLEDLKTALNYLSGAGKTELSAEYGSIAPTTVGALLRKVVALEQEGGGRFFGEPSFEVTDLLRVDAQGRGVLGVLRLVDLQDKPKLFSTFMLSLLAELYENLPEAGDLDRPKLVLFIDEAHLVFKEASRALLDQLETVVKLIRSKGVGIFFCTQLPGDIPMEVLSQLGLKIQHSLRAFTARDRKDIRLVAENYPLTDYYDVEQLITQLGIGEALVTGLNEKGVPTPLLHTYLIAPASRMDVLSEAELSELLRASALNSKYRKSIDRDSAHEILERKMRQAAESSPEPAEKKARKPSRPEPSALDKVLKSPVARSMGIAIAGSLTRALLGAFKRR